MLMIEMKQLPSFLHCVAVTVADVEKDKGRVGGAAETRERGGRGTEEARSGEEITSGERCHTDEWWLMIMISSEQALIHVFYSIFL